MSASRVLRWLVPGLLLLLTVACGSETHDSASTAATPTDASPEAGFARDMSAHHAQAVAMAEAIRDRTSDPDLKLLAADIALGQQAQIGRMSGWLDEWGLNISSTNTPMAWVNDGDTVTSDEGASSDDMAGMDMGTTGDTVDTESGATMPGMTVMPGMVGRPQITALGTLPVAEAEVSFLQLMIAHHQGGVEMAQAILARTHRPDVVRLATAIVNAQQFEIELMTDMLAQRGVST